MLQVPNPGPRVYFGSGTRLDAYHFDAWEMPPPLIGRGLSRLHRFGGAGERSVSVAQHSKKLSHVVGDCIHRQRAALMHDVPELFTGEIPRPFKTLCGGIQEADAFCTVRIGEVYGIPAWAFEAIKEADTRISYDERLFMFDHMSDEDVAMAEERKLGVTYTVVTQEVAATAWTRRFYQLFPQEKH